MKLNLQFFSEVVEEEKNEEKAVQTQAPENEKLTQDKVNEIVQKQKAKLKDSFEEERERYKKELLEKEELLKEKTKLLEQKEEEISLKEQREALLSFGVTKEDLNDFITLTANCETEEEAKAKVEKFLRPTTTTPKHKQEEPKPEKQNLRDVAKSYFGF